MKQNFVAILSRQIVQPTSLLLAWFLFLCLPLTQVLRYYLITHSLDIPSSLRYVLISIAYAPRFLIPIYCCLVLLGWLRKYTNKEIPQSQRQLLIFMALTSAFFLIINIYLMRLEGQQYPNYLYIRYGLTIEFLETMNQIYLLILSLVVALLVNGGRFFVTLVSSTRYIRKISLVNVFKLCILGVFLFTLSRSFSPVIQYLIEGNNQPTSYYQAFGEDFKAVEMLQLQTSKAAQIIHPPQSNLWPLLGNQPMIRYFLHPRTLVSGAILDNQTIANHLSSAYFVSIYPSDSEKRWPLLSSRSAEISFDTQHYLKYQDLKAVAEQGDLTLYRILFYE